jgi:hypothetical protein
MRSLRMIPALAALAVAALAIAPGWASARPSRVRRLGIGRPCAIHLETPRQPIAMGESATILGELTCPRGVSPGDRQVTVYEQSEPKPGFSPAGSATTTEVASSSGGRPVGAFQVTPAVFNTNSVFYAVSEGAQSAHRTIRVAAQIAATPPTPAEGAQLFAAGARGQSRNNRVTFAGEVSKLDAGALVVLQREFDTATEEWRAIDRGTVDEQGKYSILHKFLIPGDANVRVVVHPRRINAPSATSPTSYEISQAENPALKIETKADPLLYGESGTITGEVAGAAPGTPVTLLARGRGASFAPVATGKTGSGGGYEFTQTPLANTFYQVSSGASKSSVLFEGVKYALAFTPPASTVQAGQPLTFSGSVLPALSGHVVYLERQGRLKLGWTVIDVGTVGAPAKPGEAAPFSIVHAFYSQGARRLRVKIPGDPGNQGTASAPFELNVTPAPSAALRPEAPGNTRLPSEGQL